MNCLTHLRNKFGISQQQAIDLINEVKQERAALEGQIGNIGAQTQKLYQRLANKSATAKIEAAAHRRALTLQYAKRLEAFDFITTEFKGKEWEGISALLVGSDRTRNGSKLSVDAIQTSMRGYYIGGFLSDLQRLDTDGTHLKLLQKGALDKSIAEALWTIDNPNAKPFTGAQEAMDIAQIIHKWQEKARGDANLSGAYIGKMPGYIVRQSHDPARIANAGYQKWHDDMMGLLDWNETGDGLLITDDMKNKFLDGVYKNLVLARVGDEQANPLIGVSRIGSTASKMSQERVLHFKDSDAWFAYNQSYGQFNLREAVIHGLTSMANQTGIMQRLGPSPATQIDALYKMLEKVMRNAGDENGIKRLKASRKRVENQRKEVDGTLNIEVASHPVLAAAGRNIRALETMSKLGGVVISSFTDIPVMASELAYQGHGYFKSLARGIGQIIHGRGTKEQQEILSQLGVFFDNMCGDIVARVSGDETPGAFTRMQTMFFKLNGLTWWTDSWRRATGLMMAHELAQQKGNTWGGLNKNLQRVLKLYGITEAEWDVLRGGSTRLADGREYLTPEAIKDASDATIKTYMQIAGKAPKKGKITKELIESARFELENKVRSYFRDRINYAVLEPDARAKALLHQGQSAGTVTGEALRFVMQFKSFSATYLQKMFGREIQGREGDSKMQILGSFFRLIGMMTLFGYGSMSVKDILKGREPRDMFDGKTALAAMIQGGGVGILGDFIFGDYNRYGGGLATTLTGPTVGTAADIANIWARIREGDSAAQASLRVLQNNLPYSGLFYVKGPMDYLLTYNLYEKMKPGYFRRLKRRVKRENGQNFFMKPVNW